MPPARVRRVAEFRVAFTAADYETTVAFFRDVMALEVVRVFEVGGRGTILAAADGQIEVFAEDAGRGAPGVTGVALAWQVEDAVAAHRRLVARGAEVLGEPEMQPWGHRNFAVRGPDGWIITLYEIVVAQ